MKLLKMELNNFQGCGHFRFEPQGKDVTVRGRNGTGKTRLYNALCYCLFGKNSKGQTGFTVKTLDESGAVAGHGLDHSVECVLFDQDRGEITLKRTLIEEWASSRGKIAEKLTGHTIIYEINGKKKSATEYKKFISDICGEEKFRLLTNPLRFAEDEKRGGLGDTKRREYLQKLHPISDADVIDSDPELRPLTKLLAGKTPDEFREACKSRQTDIMGNKPGQEDYKSIKPRIDELSRTLDIPGDQQALSGQVNLLSKELGDLKTEKVVIQNGGQVAELSRQLAEVEQKIVEATTRERLAINQQTADITGVIDGLYKETCGLVRKLVDFDAAKENIEREVAFLQGEIKGLQGRFDLRRKETQPETCDKCGQPMPTDSLASWNRLKSDDLLKNLEQVEGKKQKATKAKESLEGVVKEAALLTEMKAGLQGKIDAEKARIEKLRDMKIQTPPELEGQRIRLADKIDQLKAGNGPALEALQEKIDKIEAEITATNQQIAALNEADKNRARIEELRAEEKRLAGEYDRLTQHLLLLDEFTRAKVRATEGPINDMFKMARFKMFDEQINGGLADCCEVTYRGVPFTSDLNSGHRILVGCDIIATLQRHYGFTPVLFIDNAEALTEPLPDLDCQVIRLVADEACDKLTVEF